MWRTTLNETLDEYLVGVAARRPIKESVCNFCDARSVCRVDEALTIEEVPHD